MLNKSVITLLLLMGFVLISLSTIGKFDDGMHVVAFNDVKVQP